MVVAVITPTRDRAHMIEKTIYSVRWQTYGNHIHLIVDDGSSDRTKELVEFHSKEDPRIVYARREKPKGEKLTASNAINHGFNMLLDESTIKYFTVLHSDDLLTENSISQRIKKIKENPEYALAFGNICNIDENYRIIRESSGFDFPDAETLYERTRISRSFPHHTILFSKDILKETGFYDSRIGYGEDCDMSLRLIKTVIETGSGIEYIDDFLTYYMTHQDSISGIYRKNGWDKIDNKFLDIKHSESDFDYYMKIAKRFTKRLIKRPHSFLPESVKKVLRPVRDRFLRNEKKPYRDEFLERISAIRSGYWDS